MRKKNKIIKINIYNEYDYIDTGLQIIIIGGIYFILNKFNNGNKVKIIIGRLRE